MSRIQKLAVLQWVGIFVAPLAWVGQHMVGQAIAQVSCSVANARWGVSNDAWQIGLLVGACLLILASEGAAIAVYRGTREGDYQSPPPVGRLQLFAVAAMTTNFLLFVIVLLDGIAGVVDPACRQS
ncbi:MAG: hypothetical protein V7644_75 [Actinomycetota bacterium]|jgi:hypothetical protein